MKFIMCADCAGMVSVPNDGSQATCHCGNAHAEKQGDKTRVTRNALVFGIGDSDLALTIQKRARNFTMWRIDVPCSTVDFYASPSA